MSLLYGQRQVRKGRRNMKTVSCMKLLAALALAAAFAGCDEGANGGMSRKKGASFRVAPIVRSDVVRTVEATGTVTPRNSSKGIPVGAQVNGKLIKLFADYNSVVTNGQVVAIIDPLVYEANYKSSVAQLHANEANVEVRKASLRSAEAELVSMLGKLEGDEFDLAGIRELASLLGGEVR